MTRGETVELSLIRRDIRLFADTSYRWLVVLDYRLAGDGDDSVVLAELISDPWFGDSFVAPRPEDSDPQPYHARYHLSAVTPDSYERVSGTDASTHLAQLIHRPGVTENLVIMGRAKPPEAGRTPDEHQAFVDELAEQADAAYRLRELGPEAEHGFAGSLWHFHEVVLIDRARGRVTLIAGGID